MKIFVGNLSAGTVERDVRSAFEPFGEIRLVNIARNSGNQESRGFGFVDMDAETEAVAAIRSLNGTKLGGKTLRVNRARRNED